MKKHPDLVPPSAALFHRQTVSNRSVWSGEKLIIKLDLLNMASALAGGLFAVCFVIGCV